MPSDAGSGAADQPPSLLSGLAGVSGALSAAVGAQADMAMELSSFTKFQKRVDD